MTSTQLPRQEHAVAESFSQDLDSMFGLSAGASSASSTTTGGLDGLSETVEEKKRNVSSQSQELAALEARLRETEDRLARASQSTSSAQTPSRFQDPVSGAQNHISQGQAYGGAAAIPKSNVGQGPSFMPSAASHTTQERPLYPREDSLGLPPMPGAMPITPDVRAGNDYVSVDQSR